MVHSPAPEESPAAPAPMAQPPATPPSPMAPPVLAQPMGPALLYRTIAGNSSKAMDSLLQLEA